MNLKPDAFPAVDLLLAARSILIAWRKLVCGMPLDWSSMLSVTVYGRLNSYTERSVVLIWLPPVFLRRSKNFDAAWEKLFFDRASES